MVAALIHRGVDPETVDKYLREWRTVEASAFGGQAWPVPKDAKAKMTGYIDQLRDAGVSPSSIRRRLTAANRFFEAQGAPRTLKGVRSPKPPELVLPVLDGPDAEKLLEALSKEHRDLSDACQLMLLTGLRLSEIITLRYSLDDLKAQRLRVGTGEDFRLVAVGRQARNILRRRLFAHDQWHKKPQWYSDKLRLVADRIGLSDAKPMTLRNTFAVRALAGGHHMKFVMSNMGLISDGMMRAIVAAYLDYEP